MGIVSLSSLKACELAILSACGLSSSGRAHPKKKGRATPTCDDFFYRAGQRELVAPNISGP